MALEPALSSNGMIDGGAAQTTWVAGLNPRTRLLMVTALMAAVPFLHKGWQFLGLALATLGLGLLARVRFRTILRGPGALTVLILMTFLLQLLLAPGEPLAEWGPFRISDTGLQIGSLLAGRLILLATLAALLGALVSPLELAGALEGFLKPLSRLGLPVRRLALVIGIALRFIPELQREAGRIAKAQAARGAPISGPLHRRLRRLLAVLIPLLLGALHRAERLAEALEARCYSEDHPRSSLKQEHLSLIDLLAPAAALALGLLLLLL